MAPLLKPFPTDRPILALGIESSCDETAASLVRGDGVVLADQLASQHDLHALYGGVVPEIAARAHVTRLDLLIKAALDEAGLSFADVDLVAATAGPGLIGGLMAGWVTGGAIAQARALPFFSINHLEGHALTARLTDGARFPYLLLLVSGGHTELVLVEGVGRYRRLGATIDDALGEAFDKVAKMLGLGFPGGPEVERRARRGDPGAYALPRPMAGRKDCRFSFSGLKTAVRQAALSIGEGLKEPDAVADLCASFQAAAADALADRVGRAFALLRDEGVAPSALVIAGGVAANRALRARLEACAADAAVALLAPPARLCADNAVMIAWAAIERARLGERPHRAAPPRPRWPLDALEPPQT